MKGETKMTYFNIIGGTGDENYLIRVYQTQKFHTIQEKRSYKFQDLIKKGESYWMVSSSTVAYTSGVEVTAEETNILLPEEQPAAGMKRSLGQALHTQQKSIIVGKIAQVSPVKMRREGTLAVRTLALKDEHQLVKVALFDKNAQMEFPHNSVLKVTAVYPKTYNQKPQLTASSSTNCEFLPDQALPNVAIQEEDIIDDDDFSIEEDVTAATEYEIDSIYDVFPYNSCPSLGCRRKKVQEGKHCEICKGSSVLKTYRAKISIVEKRTDATHTITLFERDLKTIFDITNEKDKNELIDQMVEKLPKTIFGKLSGSYFSLFHK